MIESLALSQAGPNGNDLTKSLLPILLFYVQESQGKILFIYVAVSLLFCIFKQ